MTASFVQTRASGGGGGGVGGCGDGGHKSGRTPTPVEVVGSVVGSVVLPSTQKMLPRLLQAVSSCMAPLSADGDKSCAHERGGRSDLERGGCMWWPLLLDFRLACPSRIQRESSLVSPTGTPSMEGQTPAEVETKLQPPAVPMSHQPIHLRMAWPCTTTQSRRHIDLSNGHLESVNRITVSCFALVNVKQDTDDI